MRSEDVDLPGVGLLCSLLPLPVVPRATRGAFILITGSLLEVAAELLVLSLHPCIFVELALNLKPSFCWEKTKLAAWPLLRLI